MSGLQLVPLGSVFEIQLGKMLDGKSTAGDRFPYLANRNVQWGTCDITDLPTMLFTLEDRERFALRPGDLLVCEGGEVGRTAIWRGERSDCYFQKAVHRLRARLGQVVPEFGLRYMQWAASRGVFARLTTSTSIAHLTKEKLEIAPFPLPAMSVQRRIAALLDEADALRRNRRESRKLLDDLLRATFHDLFGDPITNPKGWPTVRLDEVADIASGVTKGRKFAGQQTVTVPYMRVANVQDGYLRLDEVKEIEVLPTDVEACRLRAGDVLLTEGGDPDKLGRGAVWGGQIDPCIHQNHIFRVRCRIDRLLPDFASAILGSELGKRYFLRSAKQTTGIASINMTQLRGAPILLPSIQHQAKFAAVVASIRNVST